MFLPTLNYLFFSKLLFSVQTRPLGHLIHIHGHPGSGKTHILYYLLASCTGAAIVFDMDGKFSMSRFKHLLLSSKVRRIEALRIEGRTPDKAKNLDHIHIFRPTSSDQLAVTLAHLPKYHAKHFPDMALEMVAIHSLDAFYWLDRFKAEQLQSPNHSLQNIYSILQTIRFTLGSVVVLTDWGLGQSQHLHPQDNIHPKYQITLSVTHTNSDETHTLAVVKAPGQPETSRFTLRIGSNTLSLDVE